MLSKRDSLLLKFWKIIDLNYFTNDSLQEIKKKFQKYINNNAINNDTFLIKKQFLTIPENNGIPGNNYYYYFIKLNSPLIFVT